MESYSKHLYNLLEPLKNISSTTLGWIALVFLHCTFIPSIVAVLMGISDKLPTLDVVFFVWASLLILFFKSSIDKDRVKLVTNGIGFFIQALLLAMIVFK